MASHQYTGTICLYCCVFGGQASESVTCLLEDLSQSNHWTWSPAGLSAGTSPVAQLPSLHLLPPEVSISCRDQPTLLRFTPYPSIRCWSCLYEGQACCSPLLQSGCDSSCALGLTVLPSGRSGREAADGQWSTAWGWFQSCFGAWRWCGWILACSAVLIKKTYSWCPLCHKETAILVFFILLFSWNHSGWVSSCLHSLTLVLGKSCLRDLQHSRKKRGHWSMPGPPCTWQVLTCATRPARSLKTEGRKCECSLQTLHAL